LYATYFTNRQDRYILFQNEISLSAYVVELIKTISEFSYFVNSMNDFKFPSNVPVPFSDSNGFSEFAFDKLTSFLRKYQNTNTQQNQQTNINTWVSPLIQAGPMNVRQDETFVSLFLKEISKEVENSQSNLSITSPYLNFTEQYRDLILNKSIPKTKIITASPKANGFYTAKDVSKFIPYAYAHVEKKLFDLIEKSKNNNIEIYEYNRSDWTYHAKGIWYFTDGNVVTFIGSPNLSQRSTERDLEAQFMIETKDNKLQSRIKQVKKKKM